MTATVTHNLGRFFGLFGDDADLQRARDMSRRVVPAQLAAVALGTIAALTSVGHYGIWPATLLGLSEIGFLAAVLLPRRLARPELPLVAAWIVGQALLIAAAMSAGDSRAYLWAITAISIQFIGIIWTPELSIAAVFATITAMAAAMVAAGPTDAAEILPELLPSVLLLALTAAAAVSLRTVDHQSRGTVLVDSLTGLQNRVAMQQQLAAITSQGTPSAIAVFDLDHFKSINDIHGHAVGDAVLVAAATRMESEVQGSGNLYRYGGEEFVAIFTETSESQAEKIAERVRMSAASAAIGGLTVTLSAGVAAEHVRHAVHASKIFQRADAAMYQAKEDGRNCVRAAGSERTEPDIVVHELLPIHHNTDGTARPLPTRGAGRWLISSVVQRDQLLALVDGVSSAKIRAVSAALVLSGLALVPHYGWWPPAVLMVRAIVLDPYFRGSVKLSADHSRRSEAAALWEAAVSMLLIGAAVSVTSSPALYLLPLIALPAQSVSAAYPFRASMLLIVEAITIAVGACLIQNPAVLSQNPVVAAMPVAIVAAVAIVGAVVGRSAVDHRAAAIIDPLTGLLNRAALDLRLPEITEAAVDRNMPVTVIVGDLDHFKSINDIHGHAQGDVVLAAVAERIQEVVRPADALYRVGGEEFVVLLPATQTGSGTAIAERIRSVIAAEPVGDIDVTMSLGVAGSPGRGFRYSETFTRADAALRTAKQKGRNRVSISPPALRVIRAA